MILSGGISMEFAIHMRNRRTGKERVKKVVAENADVASCSDFGYKSEWEWTGSEPFHNVSEKVEHIGNGYYTKI